MSIVDVLDVVTHARPYEEAASAEVALDAIAQEKGKLDPGLATTFIELQPNRSLTGLEDALNDQGVPREEIPSSCVSPP